MSDNKDKKTSEQKLKQILERRVVLTTDEIGDDELAQIAGGRAPDGTGSVTSSGVTACCF